MLLRGMAGVGGVTSPNIHLATRAELRSRDHDVTSQHSHVKRRGTELALSSLLDLGGKQPQLLKTVVGILLQGRPRAA